ncbi:MAG: ABC transporter permease subunit [Anaerolineales bacterium]|nr:ABC transporter permease subunit [Anaerolineales bacterium]
MKPPATDLWIALVIVLPVIMLWEIAVRLLQIPPYLLPAPLQVLNTLAENAETYASASLVTLGEALAGLLLGLIAGVGTAALLGLWPRLERGVMTLAILVKSTPLVAIAPLLTIWLGFGVFPKVIITALLTFFPVLVNTLSGFRSTDTAVLDTFRAWNASRWEVFLNARVPSALPHLFAALKVAAPLALIGAVVAEWTGASGGLGRTMWLAYTNLNLPFLFAAVFVLAAMGIGLYSLVTFTEKKVIFWEGIKP